MTSAFTNVYFMLSSTLESVYENKCNDDRLLEDKGPKLTKDYGYRHSHIRVEMASVSKA